jgi:hypothetical protein
VYYTAAAMNVAEKCGVFAAVKSHMVSGDFGQILFGKISFHAVRVTVQLWFRVMVRFSSRVLAMVRVKVRVIQLGSGVWLGIGFGSGLASGL